ncbi:MAG: hypothetical protein GXY67_10965 [Clostridiales bacterium]|nr:hypothetical protein [Clostridiales bacterium]
MEPVDAVKLVYQSEFGCGHLLALEEDCIARIEAELKESTSQEEERPFTEIGSGLCRLNLRCPRVRNLSPRLIARMMIHTAQETQGNLASFLKKLDLLRALCEEGTLPFSPDQLESYLCDYAGRGYPPVSHSPRYRAAYAPAYRVICRLYGISLQVAEAVEQRLLQKGRVLLVLDGDCGAGKSTLAKALAPLWDASIIAMDDFFLPPARKTSERLATPGGNVDHERFRADVLEGLLAWQEGLSHEPYTYQAMDWHKGVCFSREVRPSSVVLIEGSYSQHPVFEDAYDRLRPVKVFLSVSRQEQLRRLKARNPALFSRFQTEWIPLEKDYFRAYDIPEKSDITLSTEEAWQ